MKKSKILAIVFLASTALLAILSFIILPDIVVTQLSVGGSGVTQLPKVVAVAIPTLLGAAGGILELVSREENDNIFTKRNVVALVGVLVFTVMLVVNSLYTPQ